MSSKGEDEIVHKMGPSEITRIEFWASQVKKNKSEFKWVQLCRKLESHQQHRPWWSCTRFDFMYLLLYLTWIELTSGAWCRSCLSQKVIWPKIGSKLTNFSSSKSAVFTLNKVFFFMSSRPVSQLYVDTTHTEKVGENIYLYDFLSLSLFHLPRDNLISFPINSSCCRGYLVSSCCVSNPLQNLVVPEVNQIYAKVHTYTYQSGIKWRKTTNSSKQNLILFLFM